MSSDLRAVQAALEQAQNPEKAVFFPRFFKAGPGEYAEGDKFLGVTVPNIRLTAKQYPNLPLADIETLLVSEWHEERLLALIMLVNRYKKADVATQQEIYEFYISHTQYINNWDLVDSSAEHIVGPWLDGRPEQMKALLGLAESASLWERRIAMLSTFYYIKQGRADETLIISDVLLHDEHDLIQKATGWMLREIGKRVDHTVLTTFLDFHAASMPRTTLRYAIEHLSPGLRQHYMGLRSLAAKN